MGKAGSVFDRAQKLEDATLGWRFINPAMQSGRGDADGTLGLTSQYGIQGDGRHDCGKDSAVNRLRRDEHRQRETNLGS